MTNPRITSEMQAFLSTPWTVDEAVDRVRQRLAGKRVAMPYSTDAIMETASTRRQAGTPISLASVAEDAEVLALTIWAHGLEGMPWNLAQPGRSAAMNLLRLAKLGIGADELLVTQFSDPRMFKAEFETAGLRWPHVELLTDVRLQALADREGTVLDLVPASLGRTLDRPKATIRTGGGPDRLPGRVLYRYSRSEIGPIALSCPKDSDALHLLSDRIAVYPGFSVRRTGEQARSIALQTGDAADVETAMCGCPLARLGLSSVLRNVRRV